MTRSEFVQEFEQENGFQPDEGTIRYYLDKNYIDDDFESQSSRQQGRVYNFSGNNYSKGKSSKAVSELIDEVESVFEDISGMSKRSMENQTKPNNTGEFTYMAMAFLCKSALYFLLKSSHAQGYEGVNL